jgi:hypothetical protein
VGAVGQSELAAKRLAVHGRTRGLTPVIPGATVSEA